VIYLDQPPRADIIDASKTEAFERMVNSLPLWVEYAVF
jgi:hypothetical protein